MADESKDTSSGGTYYAWSPIRTGDGKTIEVGATVSKSAVGDDWDYLVETGVIRKQKYSVPEEHMNTYSPEQYKNNPPAGQDEE